MDPPWYPDAGSGPTHRTRGRGGEGGCGQSLESFVTVRLGPLSPADKASFVYHLHSC